MDDVAVSTANWLALLQLQRDALTPAPSCDLCGLRHHDTCLEHSIVDRGGTSRPDT